MFEVLLQGELPHVDVWVCVVNHLGRELAIESLEIPHFYLTGGPCIDEIQLVGQARVPARHTSQFVLRRRLIDSEIRAISQYQRSTRPTATYGIVALLTAGRRRFDLNTAQLSSNGWIEGAQERKD